jgi:glycerol-3-phosphate acyltransferase PlsX
MLENRESRAMLENRIALDVMGGDRAPDAILAGALKAVASDTARRLDPARILLVGDQRTIEAGLAAAGGNPGFAVRHATQVIGMGESPATALRAKPDSSIGSCVRAVKGGEAGAAVSMGNTGAMVGAATLGLGTLEGVKRPGIAVTLELTGKPMTLLDMGANIAPKPEHLVQYGVMGSAYVKSCLGIAEPRVGLLNVGEEESKGTDLLKAAHQALRASPVEFVGNLEGSDVFSDKADVLVTDGFTGNVILKLLENFAGFLLGMTLAELGAHGIQAPPAAVARVKQSIDYSEYGGALLLGVAGVVIIGHGRSDANAVANALHQAARALDARVNAHIVEGFERALG